MDSGRQQSHPEARDCDVFTIDSVEPEAMDSPQSCVTGGFIFRVEQIRGQINESTVFYITSMLDHLIRRDR